MVEAWVVVVGVVIAGALVRKKFDIKIVMFATGLFFMGVAAILGYQIMSEEASSGIVFFDMFRSIGRSFSNQLSGAGLIVMILFGYTAYMSEIGANDMTVKLLSTPLTRIKNKRLIVPVFFLIASSLCMIIPSASSLGLLLMATAFPILAKGGVSPLAAGSMIAMAAGVAPTPLGIDNVMISEELGMSLGTYVFGYHALVSIPVILILSIVHYFWQGYCDRKEEHVESVTVEKFRTSTQVRKAPKFYAFLPMLPLLFMVTFTVLNWRGAIDAELELVELTLFAFVISIIIDSIRRAGSEGISVVRTFWNGMSNGFITVVVQVVAALTFIDGIRSLGIIARLSTLAGDVVGGGILAILIFCAFIVFVGLVSGTGLSLFYGLIPDISGFALAAGVPVVTLMISMQFTAHFVKTISPLAPVMLITSGMMGITPIKLAKRTVVPSIIGAIVSIILAYLVF